MKAFADDKINVVEKLRFFWKSLKTLWEKGKNAGHQHFVLFPQCFLKTSSSRPFQVMIVWERVKALIAAKSKQCGRQIHLNLR